MKKISLFFLLTVLIFFTSCTKAGWLSSFSEAKKQAEKTGKDIFMVVSGGEDSSAEFKKNVLDSKDFILQASKNFVLIFINLSADGLQDLSQEELSKVYEENSKIIMDYNITEELTLLRLTKEGYWLYGFPFTEKYHDVQLLLSDLSASDEKISDAKSFISAIKKSDGSEKVKAIDNLYEYTDEHYRLPIMPLCYEIPSLDAENVTGLLGKYELITAYDTADKMLSPETVDEAAAVFKEIAENGHLDKSQRFEAYFTAAYLYPLVGSTDFDSMTLLLEKAYEANPDDAHAGEVTDLMQNIKDMKTVYENSLNTESGESPSEVEE